MILRKARKSDAKGIAEVMIEFYNISSIKEGVNAFREETCRGHNFIVAIEGKKVVGFTSWLAHGLAKHGLAELDRIAVLEELRGKGTGKKLFNFLEKEAKEYYKKRNSRLRKLFILTHASNTKAQAFYSSLGLKHETTLKNHYYAGEDEFVFSKFF
ncbi:MAG: GNAT family N-acetyltransferase [archaeon]|nr:GNAT family N-acetyltransferase [Candidatus Micrarchaeota archaeon]